MVIITNPEIVELKIGKQTWYDYNGPDFPEDDLYVSGINKKG